MSKYKSFLIICLLLLCVGCKKKDNSLACTAIFGDCEDIINETRKSGKSAIKLYGECFDLAQKYECDMQQFKNYVFGFMPGWEKNPKAK